MITEGEDIKECLTNAREAFVGLIAEYVSRGTEIPSQREDEEKPSSTIEEPILVLA